MKNLDIFIVDDDQDFAEGMAEVLELKGYKVHLASSGEEAVEKFRKQDFDITFMDVKLPGMDGVRSFLEIRKIRPSAKVMMITAYSVKQLLDQALENGAWGVLQKPLNIEHVLEMLDKIMPKGILLADDDRDFVDGIRAILEMKGYKVYAVHNGKEAVEQVKSNAVDALILDLQMPLLSGLDVYLELERSGHAVPTIIVTAYAGKEAAALDRLRTLSVTGILTKPFDPQDLLKAVEDIFGTCAAEP